MKVYELVMDPTATITAESIVKIGQRELAKLAELVEQAGAQAIGVALTEVKKCFDCGQMCPLVGMKKLHEDRDTYARESCIACHEQESNADQEFENNKKLHEEWIEQSGVADEEEDEDEDVEDEE